MNAHQPGPVQLFSAAPVPSIPGLTYMPNYLAADEAAALIQRLDQHPWSTELRRRVQQYGYRYDYTRHSVTPDMRLGTVPPWLQAIAERVSHEGYTPAIPDQVIINEYLPGQGIADHVDCIPCFGDTILSVSLGSGCVMRFIHVVRRTSVSLWLAPGSLVVLQGEARYDWSHGIAPRTSDVVAGIRVPRQRRVSLTLRTVLVAPSAGGGDVPRDRSRMTEGGVGHEGV
jgi:alkylated DNA repair dioxygenase AlkB